MMYNNGVLKWKGYVVMYCLRCGNETTNEEVFCEKCLNIMEQYPVKPGTPIKIPYRSTTATVKKQARKKGLTPEEQIIRLKVHLRTLLALLGAAIVLMSIFAFLYFQESKKQNTRYIQSDKTSYSTSLIQQ